jgi:hypothetical protein
MLLNTSMHQDRPLGCGEISSLGFCAQKHRLSEEFLQAIHEVNVLLTQQLQAVIDGDSGFPEFDVLIHIAQQKKDRAKYAWIAHVESHHCEGQ